MNSRRNRGVTLVEIMVTLTIVVIVLSLAVVTMQGYIPKQRLLSTVGMVENILQRAQSEAGARSYWTCVRFDADGVVKGYVDVNNTHLADGGCGAAGDLEFQKAQIMKPGVTLATSSGCGGLNVKTGCSIWFDPTGSPKHCPFNTPTNSCGSADPAIGNCRDETFQIVLTSQFLDTGTRSREIEVLQGGIIQTVKPGEVGLTANVWAHSGAVSGTGCE